MLQMGHYVWDSKKERKKKERKKEGGTVTDHRHKDYRYNSIAGKATVLQDSILLEYDIVSLGKRFPIFV
jgi:hypothetical protein